MKRIVYGLLMAVVLGLCGAGTATAATLTINFSGTFDSYANFDTLTFTHPLLGNDVSGSITFSQSHPSSPDDLSENKTKFDHTVWNASITGAPGLNFGGTQTSGTVDIADLGNAVNAALFTGAINLNLDWSPTSQPLFTLANFPATAAAANTFFGVVMNSSGDVTEGNETFGFSITDFNATVSATPIPATLPLFVSGLAGIGFLGWKRRRSAAL
jgi:hypothetical protein